MVVREELGGVAYHFRLYDFRTEDPKRWIALKEATYGKPVSESRWRWQYLEHPLTQEIRVFMAESGGRIVAATSRFPFDIRIGNRIQRAWFNLDSMVHPQHRRRGLMETLYNDSAKTMPLLYSKGTSPEMYRLLQKMGYRSVSPNTFLVKYLSPIRLIAGKVGLYSPSGPKNISIPESGEYVPVDRFGKEHDEILRLMSEKFDGAVAKTASYMNWRYRQIPHKKYNCFVKIRQGEPVALFVFRVQGTGCIIPEILWDPNLKDEPGSSIKDWINTLKGDGFLKITCWGTHRLLRSTLRGNGFTDRGLTPHFSVLSDPSFPDCFTDGEKFHFVDGDGDSEFL